MKIHLKCSPTQQCASGFLNVGLKKKIKKKLLSPGNVLFSCSKHKICALQITENVGPHSRLEYGFWLYAFVLALLHVTYPLIDTDDYYVQLLTLHNKMSDQLPGNCKNFVVPSPPYSV